MNEGSTATGSPTQQAPADQIREIELIAKNAERKFRSIAERIQKDIDSLAIITSCMQRCVKRMEILRETLRPLPPVDPKFADDRLCKGERAILDCLKQAEPLDIFGLSIRTGYARSSLRTWLPMLRKKGLVHPTRLTLTDADT